MGPPRLLADIGGTRARFALSEGPGELGPTLELATPTAPPGELVRNALLELDPGGRIREARLAVAGPVAGGMAALTNLPWRFEAAAIGATCGLASVTLVNDFAALAHALPLLGPDDRRFVGGTAEVGPRKPLLVLGPGTGLGMAAAVPDGDDGWIAVAGEGGHVTLPARTGQERHAIAALEERFGHVSAERVCSGPGLVALHAAITEGPAERSTTGDAAAIGAAARDGEASARACLGLFADFLGTVASDAALTLGARGGVFLAGGVLPRLGDAFDWTRFHRRFLDKGRFRSYLEAIPVFLVTHPQPGLLGLTAEGLAGAAAP